MLQIFQSNSKNSRWDLKFSFGVTYSLNKKVHYALLIKFQMAIGYGKQPIQVQKNGGDQIQGIFFLSM